MLGLVGLSLAAWLASPESKDRAWMFWGGAYLFMGWIGFFLPFVTFAGGLPNPNPTPSRSVAVRAAGTAILLFLVTAYGEPLAEYRSRAEIGLDPAIQFPKGPRTPGGLLSLRAAVRTSPPDRFSFSIDLPFAWPPNWLLFSFHLFLVLSAYCVLSAFLGQLTAYLTNGLSPPVRTNTRWALGLLYAFLFLAALAVGNWWVRQAPSNSGPVAAWAPLVVPLIELGLLMWLARLGGHKTPPDLPGSQSD